MCELPVNRVEPRRHISLLLLLLIALSGLATLTSCGPKAGPGTGAVNPGGATGTGTGGGGGTPGGGGNGTVVILLRDAPADNVLALQASITAMNLVSSGGTVTLLTTPIDQEFRGHLLRNTVLAQRSVAAGAYTRIELTLATPGIAFFQATDQTFVRTTPDFPTSSATVTISATVTAGQVTPILLELDLGRSVSFTQSGSQLSPTFTPTFTARVLDLSVDVDNLARVDDLIGEVSNVNSTNNTFSITPLGTSDILNVTVDSATLFPNLSGISGLTSGSLVDLDARLQTSGNYLAEEVELRGTSSLIELRGPVVQIRERDSLNNVTRFDIVVREATETIIGAEVAHLATIRVTPGQTVFRVDSLNLPVGTVTFDPQSIFVGQAVAVELASSENLNGFEARSITLKQEAFAGNVGLEIGQNVLSSFVPGSDLLRLLLLEPRGLVKMTVTTSLETQFENLVNNVIPPNQNVTVRGLLFSQFDQPLLVAKRIRAQTQ